jgi:hypothetical protein
MPESSRSMRGVKLLHARVAPLAAWQFSADSRPFQQMLGGVEPWRDLPGVANDPGLIRLRWTHISPYFRGVR